MFFFVFSIFGFQIRIQVSNLQWPCCSATDNVCTYDAFLNHRTCYNQSRTQCCLLLAQWMWMTWQSRVIICHHMMSPPSFSDKKEPYRCCCCREAISRGHFVIVSPMTDRVVDWTFCWQLQKGSQELMRFNWSVSCQLSLVPHLTLSDTVYWVHCISQEDKGTNIKRESQ